MIVHIINMHAAAQDIREPFFCDIMTNVAGATNACNEYYNFLEWERTKLDKRRVEMFSNVRTPQIYEEITYWARENQSWSIRSSSSSSSSSNEDNDNDTDELSDKIVMKKVQNYYEKVLNRTEYDFPDDTKICITEDQYDWVFERTREYEEYLFPEYYKSVGQYEIQQQYSAEHDG